MFCFVNNAKVNSPVNGWEENPCVQVSNKALIQQLCTNGEPGSATGLVHVGKSPQDRQKSAYTTECVWSQLIISS